MKVAPHELRVELWDSEGNTAHSGLEMPVPNLGSILIDTLVHLVTHLVTVLEAGLLQLIMIMMNLVLIVHHLNMELPGIETVVILVLMVHTRPALLLRVTIKVSFGCTGREVGVIL